MESRIILILGSIILIFFRNFKIELTKTYVYLFMFCLTFYLISVFYHPENITFYIIPYLLSPCLSYLIGEEMLKWDKGDYNKQLKKILYLVIFGRFFHGFLNIIESNFFVGINRNGQDFWTKSILAATLQGTLITLSISLFFFSIFVVKNRKEKILILLAVFISLFNSFATASRTAVIIMIVVFISNCLYYLFCSKYSLNKKIKFIVFLSHCYLYSFWRLI